MSHATRTTAGVGLLILGAIGILVPIVSGIPFLVAGVAVLGTDHAIVKRGRQWLDSDHPLMRRVRGLLERLRVLKPHRS
ncbi:MAG: hypothetical protein ACRD5L_03920 [Bryobacteraceae bacterium]